jgi:hypothetical protein
MGSDACVYQFNIERYREYIVPAFKHYLLHGLVEEWLQKLIETVLAQPIETNSTDLDRFCTYLDADLAWNASYDATDTWFDGWSKRACKSTTCPERFRCPYHQNAQPSIVEDLNILIEAAATAFCLGEAQFVGRTITVKAYWKLLQQLNISDNDPLRSLLLKLGKRGFVIGYGWAGSAEGIHGWLNVRETEELAQRLLSLSLPQYPATFQAMDHEMKSFLQHSKSGSVDFPFEALSLSFVRTVAVIAADNKEGILWGNDVINYPGYLPQNLNLES